MFEAAYQIGTTLLEEKGITPEKTIYLNPNADKIVILSLDTPQIQFRLLDYDADKHQFMYPFRNSKGAGAGIVPTLILNTTHPKRTVEKKLIGWFKKHKKSHPLVEKGLAYLNQHEEQIIDKLNEKLVGDLRNQSILLTVEFSNSDENQQFLKYVDNSLLNTVSQKYRNKYNLESMGAGECYFCGVTKNVNGFAAPLAFYTHDKVTYSSNFDRSTTWRNFPVCDSCEFTAEYGVNYIEQELKFNFFGVSYMLFPQVVNRSEMSDLIEMLREAHENRERGAMKVALTTDEDEILEELADQNNYMTLSFLFFKKNNSQFEILGLVNDVLPSRLGDLFSAKKKIENTQSLKRWWEKLPWRDNSPEEFNFTYKFLRDIFPKSPPGEGGHSDIYRSQFIEIVGASLNKSKVEPTALLVPITRMIQHLFANRDTYETTFYHFSMRSLALYMFFFEIECLRDDTNMNITEIPKNLNIESSKTAKLVLELFTENKYFNHPTKCAAFITGILSREVGERQQSNLRAKPFYERFDGLRLTPRKIKRVFTDAIAKLHEYDADKNEILSLETLASYYYMKDGVAIGNDDLCFAFAMGLSYGKAIWTKMNKGDNE